MWCEGRGFCGFGAGDVCLSQRLFAVLHVIRAGFIRTALDPNFLPDLFPPYEPTIHDYVRDVDFATGLRVVTD